MLHDPHRRCQLELTVSRDEVHLPLSVIGKQAWRSLRLSHFTANGRRILNHAVFLIHCAARCGTAASPWGKMRCWGVAILVFDDTLSCNPLVTYGPLEYLHLQGFYSTYGHG